MRPAAPIPYVDAAGTLVRLPDGRYAPPTGGEPASVADLASEVIKRLSGTT
ncbi:MAG TPA: hypothetical protein VJT31_37220 [Rugosimonospora sp.]|nr:hypothetical protein [Rugosimonospora sp.]